MGHCLSRILISLSFLVPAVSLAQTNPAVWPAGENVCSGPWLYQRYKECRHPSHGVDAYKKRRSEVCGIETQKMVADSSCPIVSYKSCAHPSHGLEKTINFQTKWIRMGGKCFDDCGKERCADHARRLRKQYPEGTKVKVLDVKKERQAVVDWVRTGAYRTNCRFAVEQPVYYEKASPECGVEKREACKEVISYKECEHPQFGVAEFRKARDKACEEVEKNFRPTAEFTSLQNLAENLEIVQDTVVCTTCDGMPVRNRFEQDQKAECLVEELARWIEEKAYSQKAAGNMKASLNAVVELLKVSDADRAVHYEKFLKEIP